MSIKCILAITDLFARDDIAVRRAGQLAATQRATVKLIYVPPHREPIQPASAARLAASAGQLEERLELRVRTAPAKASTMAFHLEHLVAEARGMDLVVLPHRRERSTAAFFRGHPVLRLLRRCCCPVLVARQPRAGAYRQRIAALADSFDARRTRVLTAIGRGDPGPQTVIQQEHSGADLVVLGKSRSSAWEDFFLGSVAHRVLSWGSSDVLLVPQAFLEATAPVAARRVGRHGSPSALPMRPAGRRLS